MYGITGQHYAIDDDVFPIFDLHPAVEPRIDTEQTGVKLFIGPRGYQWPRACPGVCSVRAGSYIPLDGPQTEELLTYPKELHGSIAALTGSAGLL